MRVKYDPDLSEEPLVKRVRQQQRLLRKARLLKEAQQTKTWETPTCADGTRKI